MCVGLPHIQLLILAMAGVMLHWMFYRVLKFLGYDITYCRNFTDIDDKIIKQSTRTIW